MRLSLRYPYCFFASRPGDIHTASAAWQQRVLDDSVIRAPCYCNAVDPSSCAAHAHRAGAGAAISASFRLGRSNEFTRPARKLPCPRRSAGWENAPNRSAAARQNDPSARRGDNAAPGLDATDLLFMDQKIHRLKAHVICRSAEMPGSRSQRSRREPERSQCWVSFSPRPL